MVFLKSEWMYKIVYMFFSSFDHADILEALEICISNMIQ